MACELSISNIEGTRNETGDFTGIQVQGTSNECRQVEVLVSCLDRRVGGIESESFIVDVEADGSWIVNIGASRLPDCIACYQPLTVTATCIIEGNIIHPDCSPVSQTLSLPCPGSDCPDVRVTTYISPSCNADRSRNVVFNISVVDAPPGIGIQTQLIAGDGTEYTPRTDRAYAIGHPYDATAPRNVNPRLRILSPAGCPDIVLPSLAVPYCEIPPPPPGPVCPTLRRVTATTIPSEIGCQVLWVAEVEPPGEGTYEWSFDGVGEAPNRSRSALKTYADSGEHRVDVRFRPDNASCPLSRMTGSADLSDCEPPEGGGDGESTGCIIARVAMVAVLATAIVAAALATCLSPPQPWLIAAALFAAAFIIVAILWGVFCSPKPCKWFLLVTAQAAYAAGLMLVNSIGCCTVLGYVGAGVATAGLLLLIAWKQACNESWCTFAREIAFVTVGVLAQIFVLLGAICGTPGFAEEPLPALIWGVFNLLGIAFIAAGLGCSIAADDLTRDALEDEDLTPRFPDDG